MTQECTNTSDRVCSGCRTSCDKDFYIGRWCNRTHDMRCVQCATTCAAGQHLSSERCLGSEVEDVVLKNCRACLASCGDGQYLSALCPGNTTVSNLCLQCDTKKGCGLNQYRGGCSGLSDTVCVDFTVCSSGLYLADESKYRDGVCRQCSTCTSGSLARQCTLYDDAVCRGSSSCEARSPCSATTAAGRFAQFCDYSLGEYEATCGLCPPGYGTDGQYCIECPRGYTCNRLGQPVCRGQCPAGFQSECDASFGLNYVQCTTPCSLPAPDARRPWRGSFELADAQNCATYFLCVPGTYKNFSTGGTVSCDGCNETRLPPGARWVTDGLSEEDDASCLWECKPDFYAPSADGLSCVAKSGRSKGFYPNEAGFWSNGAGGGVCGQGRTSQENASMYERECLQCQALLPDVMRWADKTTQCEFLCIDRTDTRRGSRCVRERWACNVQGVVRLETGPCVPQAFPWNRPGSRKTGVVVSETTQVQMDQRPAVYPLARSVGHGIRARHFVKASASSGERQVEGRLCSAVTGTLAGIQYIFGTPCNQSFLVYLNLSAPSSDGLHVLIGNTTRGWRDGFKTQALFESELHLAWAGDGVLFVLDTWNCLLREVVVGDRPGSYLTRVYTLWGNTEKLLLATPEAKCYGPGSLPWPRRFWPITSSLQADDWLAFADEDGLWQFHKGTRELLRIATESEAQFEADELLFVATQECWPWNAEPCMNRRPVILLFRSGWTWVLTASEEACPDERTSLMGAACTVECRWRDAGNRPAQFVDNTTGLCRPCSALLCGRGQELVLCTPKTDAFCRSCAPAVNSTYVEAGTCDAGNLRPVPPCEAGWYLAESGLHCERCPAYTATLFAGATRREQCKCVHGMIRGQGGGCLAERLFEFDTVCAGSACQVPTNARPRTDDGVACGWTCNNGFYRDSRAGFADSCRPCLIGAGRTRGDNDEPWSCE
jgi:hypothetical protein